MNKIYDNLKLLCEADGVSGLEHEAASIAAKLLSNYTSDIKIDDFQNVIGYIKSKKADAKTILLDAHIDEIGMIVTDIDDKGYIKFSNCGGVDRRTLAAQVVIIHGKKKITGVIGSKPPHIQSKEEANKISKIDDMFIDVGFSKEESLNFISLGDRITISSKMEKLLNNKVSCKAMDDRCGVTAILYALELLKNEDLNINLAILFSSKEECGAHGVKTAAYSIAPDIAIAVDVSFAMTSDSSAHKCGKMSNGVMIGYHATLDNNLSNTMVTLAKENNIPYQLEIMSGSDTGTNADNIITTKTGVKTSCLSIPIRYMHTTIETLDLNDIIKTSKLIESFVKSL